MKRNLFCFLILLFSVNMLIAQEYKKAKVTLNSGVTVEGKKALLTTESFSLQVLETRRTYALDEVQLVQAKQGKAGKWALGFGGGCAALVVISGVIAGSEGIEDAGGTTGTYILGGVLWTGIFAGVGAIIGALVDNYETVYIRQSSSRFKNFNLKVIPNPIAKPALGLSYSIPIH